MPRKRGEAIKIWGPEERYPGQPGKHNRWCIFQVYVGDRRIERTCEGVTDKAEARSLAREYLGAAEAVAREQCSAPTRPATFRELAERYKAARGVSKREQTFIGNLVACRLASLGNSKLGDIELAALVPSLGQEAANTLYGNNGRGSWQQRPRQHEEPGGPYAIPRDHPLCGKTELAASASIEMFKTVSRKTPRPRPGDQEKLLTAIARYTRTDKDARLRILLLAGKNHADSPQSAGNAVLKRGNG